MDKYQSDVHSGTVFIFIDHILYMGFSNILIDTISWLETNMSELSTMTEYIDTKLYIYIDTHVKKVKINLGFWNL